MSVLEVEGLEKRYGASVALASVSFSVERGAVYGLLGQNGAGKTTTLACLLGLLRPSAGRIRVLGEPPERLYRTQGRVGVVFDETVLVRGCTVRGQLDYVRRLLGHGGGREASDALERVGMTRLARRRVTRLSLGEKKRLAVAAALLGKPELLVLDEPLSGLDPLGARDLLRLVRTLAADGLTILLSSHRLRDIEPVLTHAAVLVSGRVVTRGSLDELLSTRGSLRVRVDDRARALAALSGIDGVTAEAVEDDALRVRPGALDPAELNRRLVAAGVGVRALHPEEDSLSALFERLSEPDRATVPVAGSAAEEVRS